MSAVPTSRFTIQEYLARERDAQAKSEYYRGQIFAMAGGTYRHNTIVGNLFARLYAKLTGTGCTASTSDQRIRVPDNDFNTYPDVSVVCGEPKFDDEDRDAIINPRVLVEVLSPSTENYNRGNKFVLYRGSATLREYILVSQERPHIERFTRQENGSWLLTEFDGLNETLEFTSLDCVLPLAEIYTNVKFGPDTDAPALQLHG